MVFRVYVEKKPGFDVAAQQLANELRTILGIEALKNVRLVNRYDGRHQRGAVRPGHADRVQRAAGGQRLRRPA